MLMAKSIPLDEQIVTVLTKLCSSTEAVAVRNAAEIALADLISRADAADVAALDPVISDAQATELRQAADALRFDQDRLEARVSALSARVADLLDAERAAGSQEERDAATAERDLLAAEIAERYPAIVTEMSALVKRIIASDERCTVAGILNIQGSAEAIGRGVPAHWSLPGGSPIRRLKDIKLPLPDGSRNAWENTISGWTYRGLDMDAHAAFDDGSTFDDSATFRD